jgi:hypothetical protein
MSSALYLAVSTLLMSRPLGTAVCTGASRRRLVVAGGRGKTQLFGEADGGTRTRDPRLGKPHERVNERNRVRTGTAASPHG